MKTSISNNYFPPRIFYMKNILHEVFSNNSTLNKNSYPKGRHCAKASKKSFTVKNNGITISSLANEFKKNAGRSIYSNPVLKKHKKRNCNTVKSTKMFSPKILHYKPVNNELQNNIIKRANRIFPKF